jgi:soluble cytochrome b562
MVAVPDTYLARKKTMNIETKEQLIVHIEGLQATLSKRNARIEELESQIEKLKRSPANKDAERKGYRQGWKDCASRMMEITRKTALDLREIRKDAFDLYIDGDKE